MQQSAARERRRFTELRKYSQERKDGSSTKGLSRSMHPRVQKSMVVTFTLAEHGMMPGGWGWMFVDRLAGSEGLGFGVWLDCMRRGSGPPPSGAGGNRASGADWAMPIGLDWCRTAELQTGGRTPARTSTGLPGNGIRLTVSLGGRARV